MKPQGRAVAEVLRVEGTDRYQVLAYLLFPAGSDLDSAVATCHRVLERVPSVTLYPLVSDAWPAEVVVAEATLDDPRLIPDRVAEVLRRTFGSAGCIGVVCMFDGAFYSFDDILSPEVADQTYALCIREGAPVICLSTEVLVSPGWAEVIRTQRGALGWADPA